MAAVTPIRQQVQLCIGKAGLPVGSLIYVRQGRRENCAFAYDAAWLANPACFNVSADLQLMPGHQPHKAASPHDSVFHGAIADTAPDAWGRRIIARDHAKRRRADPQLPALTELDYLLAVDDFSRVGALRLRDADGTWHRTVAKGRRNTPPLIELEHIYQASRAVERGQESAEDLRYLQGKGTSLGGMRPKCTMVDEDGWLAIGKFPSVGDTRSVTRGEVLALLPRATVMVGVPTFYTRLLDQPGFTAASAANMRVFISGSAPLLAETNREFEQRTGQIVLERYGMTESAIIASNPFAGERRIGSVGLAIDGVEVRIADAPHARRPKGWTSLRRWSATLPNVDEKSARARWALAFDLILTSFGRTGATPLSPDAIAALRDFVIAGLTAPPTPAP